MPLINLKTDLKSLRYGKDTPGGGYSGQPYIQAKIPDGLSPKSPDFFLRNGYLNPVSTAKDVSRLTKMFLDLKSPAGLFFTAKQEALSQTAVRTRTSGILNARAYNPLSTLAQAGVISIGGHLNKQGDPLEETGAYAQGNYLYFNVIKNDNIAALNSPDGILRNRLVALYTNKVQNESIGGFALTNNISEFPTNILEYIGGPGSNLGIGSTAIRFSDQRTGTNNPLSISDPNYFYGKYKKQSSINYLNIIGIDGVSQTYARLANIGVNNGVNVLGQLEGNYNFNVYTPGATFAKNSPLIYANNAATYDQAAIINESEEEPNSGKKTGAPKIYDFRRILKRNLEANAPKNVQDSAQRLGQTPDTTAYTDQYYEKRVNIGGGQNFGPGNSTGKNLVSYTNGSGIGPVDKINALSIYRSEAVTQDSVKNDLVKFRIAAIDGGNPNFKTFMHFRAFIDSFSDSYTSTWGSVRYLGRGENFYNYTGFDRAISMGFTVAAQSKEELIPMYKKLNYLASQLAPDYSSYGYMRGPLVQLTIGGYLYEQPGFISTLTYTIPEDSPWEIGINDAGNSDSTVKELPHRITATMAFTPIHNFVPSKQGITFDKDGSATSYGNQRFIALSNGINENYNNTSGGSNDINSNII